MSSDLIPVPRQAAMSTIPAWLVKFDCGHTRHPDAHYCDGDEPHAPHDGPPPIGWVGWCDECKDYRTTVNVIHADPLDAGHTAAMEEAGRVIAAALRNPEAPR